MSMCWAAPKRWMMSLCCVCRELRMMSYHPAAPLFLLWLLNKFALAFLTCTLALGGAAIGSISGAIKGNATETGLARGFGVGAVAGAITAVQFMDGEPFSKVSLICSLLNGKIFMEWVSPAMLKAYQWQVSATETSMSEISDIFDGMNTISPGLSHEAINELPVYEFYSNNADERTTCETSCAICLQDLKDGESGRLLPNCTHNLFHLHCIDTWLTRQGSCPICRQNV